MKVICTTSDRYLHLIPVFTYLFNKYWDKEQEVTILGYNEPPNLPSNFTFHSMGTQGAVNEWSTDLRKYFEVMDETYFIWMMEDCFIRKADTKVIEIVYKNLPECKLVGRFDLTNDVQKRKHLATPDRIIRANQDTNYRFSTQPSIWNKKFLLQYLTPGLTPWEAEKQECKNDGWEIYGLANPPLKVNEGVRRFDPHKLDLNGFSEEDINNIAWLIEPYNHI